MGTSQDSQYGPAIEPHDTPARKKNQHGRDPQVAIEEHDEYGQIVKIVDPDPEIEGRTGEINSSIHLWIRPAPYGFRADMWWLENGTRHHSPHRIAYEDPRSRKNQRVLPRQMQLKTTTSEKCL
jgi:hypothetical protein